jgi:hypothetical protein
MCPIIFKHRTLKKLWLAKIVGSSLFRLDIKELSYKWRNIV